MSYNLSSRVRHFDLVFYGKEIELMELLADYKARIAHYVYIKHDKDVYEEDIVENDEIVHKKGDLKKPHFHVIVDTYNGATCSAMKRLFTTKEDKPRVLPVNDQVACYEYLWHKNNPEKYQYSKKCLCSDDLDYYERMCVVGQVRDTDSVAMHIVEDIIAGVNPRILCSRYGRDFIIHYNQYKDMAWTIEQWEKENRWRENANVSKVRLEERYDLEKLPFDE